MLYKFYLDGRPTPLARPRFGSGKVYDKQKEIKQRDMWQLKVQMNNYDVLPIKAVCTLRLKFYLSINSTFSVNKKRAYENQPHKGRPDLSNLIKYIEDILQDVGIVKDDCLFYLIEAQKLYSSVPRSEIEIEV